MATTKARLADEIMLLLSGGRVGSATKWHPNEIKISICQVANQLLKMEYFSNLTPLDEFIPNGAAIATYENNLIVPWSNTSKTTLPAMPIRMPRNLGVYQIFSQADYFSEFIPLQLGEASIIRSQGLVSSLSGSIGYECSGLDVIFTQDLTTPNVPVYVTIRLVILDFTQYSDYDILPLPPEYELQIKQQVVQLYSQEEVPDVLVDPGVKEGKTPIPQQRQA
jgi:hypothetical protein